MIDYSAVTGIDLKVTDKCMLKCDFCVNRDGTHEAGVVDVYGVTQALREILNSPTDLANLDSVFFTGGETLLAIDRIKEIAKSLPEGIFTSVVTNGLLLDKDCLDKLKEIGIHRIKVSYDTVDPSLLAVIRNGATQDMLSILEENIRESVRHGFLVFLRVALTQKNARELDLIYQRAIDLGVACLQIKPVIFSGRAIANPMLMLERKEIMKSFDSLSKIYDERSLGVTISCFPPAEEYGFTVKGCANMNKLYLDIDGSIYICNYAKNEHNLLGNYLGINGIRMALWKRKNMYLRIFNKNGIVEACPSRMNYS